tara:strand:+ start:231 stop:452 length:222 start_codon:yes stop_codon:yes gene_type:complete
MLRVMTARVHLRTHGLMCHNKSGARATRSARMLRMRVVLTQLLLRRFMPVAVQLARNQMPPLARRSQRPAVAC